ncbi:hypothetical protein J4479_02185 [Candidatus Woesearchaeota archaeon]|nr:hypothetical protein [Candidatus Woesearchaeota archaeon]
MLNTDPHLGLIIGTMFSEKTTELIAALRKYEVIGFKTQLFKPDIDNRYSIENAATHSGISWPATLVETANNVASVADLAEKLKAGIQVVGVEEGQFFEKKLAEYCRHLVNERDTIVYVAGLPVDIMERPFPTMAEIMPYANNLIFKQALCKFTQGTAEVCGRPASRVIYLGKQGLNPETEFRDVGGAEKYSPRCQKHYQIDAKT